MAGLTLSSDVWRGVGIVGFLCAGILFVVASGVSLAAEGPVPLLDAQMAVALGFLLVGTVGVYAVQKPDIDRLGRWSVPILVGGLLLTAVGTAATHLELPLSPAADAGVPLAGVGGLLVGASASRSGTLPGWSGVVLAVGFPAVAVAGVVLPNLSENVLAAPGVYSGALLPGLCWFAVTYALWTSAPDRYGT